MPANSARGSCDSAFYLINIIILVYKYNKALDDTYLVLLSYLIFSILFVVVLFFSS